MNYDVQFTQLANMINVEFAGKAMHDLFINEDPEFESLSEEMQVSSVTVEMEKLRVEKMTEDEINLVEKAIFRKIRVANFTQDQLKQKVVLNRQLAECMKSAMENFFHNLRLKGVVLHPDSFVKIGPNALSLMIDFGDGSYDQSRISMTFDGDSYSQILVNITSFDPDDHREVWTITHLREMTMHKEDFVTEAMASWKYIQELESAYDEQLQAIIDQK
jgi:hypothetical protein